MTSLHTLVDFLDGFFQVHRFPDEASGLLQPTERPVRSLGLALEWGPDVAASLAGQPLDALFLHRSWHREGPPLPGDLGLITYHLPFDEALTLGWNPRLADALGLMRPEVIGRKQGRPIGMIGDVAPRAVREWHLTIADVFGGHEEAYAGTESEVTRIAVVGAMTEALVREAAERGAELYLTGQVRKLAREAVRETGINVLAVGHERSEQWGLRAVAHLLRERFCDLDVSPIGNAGR